MYRVDLLRRALAPSFCPGGPPMIGPRAAPSRFLTPLCSAPGRAPDVRPVVPPSGFRGLAPVALAWDRALLCAPGLRTSPFAPSATHTVVDVTREPTPRSGRHIHLREPTPRLGLFCCCACPALTATLGHALKATGFRMIPRR